jgi:hypothetical protein
MSGSQRIYAAVRGRYLRLFPYFYEVLWQSLDEESTIRDVGVAGSNPVTPTIDLIIVFSPLPAYGSRSPWLTVPRTVPVSTQENHAGLRLSLAALGHDTDYGISNAW